MPPVPPASGAAIRSGGVSGSFPPLECPAVIAHLLSTEPAKVWPPPCPLAAGDPLRLGFEGPDGSMPITRDYCLAQRYEGAGEYVIDWSEQWVSDYCARVASGAEGGTYGDGSVGRMRTALTSVGVAGTTGLVLGSETPWVECVGLNAGAALVHTFEYGKIVSTHPRLRSQDYRRMAVQLAAEGGQVDWVATFSSLEHSGLGRYGDALNPEGDREALQQAWCMLKPGGALILGLPMSCTEKGFVEFNAHRYYGFARLAHIASNYELVGFSSGCLKEYPSSGSIVILRKPLEGSVGAPPTAHDFQVAAGVQ